MDDRILPSTGEFEVVEFLDFSMNLLGMIAYRSDYNVF